MTPYELFTALAMLIIGVAAIAAAIRHVARRGRAADPMAEPWGDFPQNRSNR